MLVNYILPSPGQSLRQQKANVQHMKRENELRKRDFHSREIGIAFDRLSNWQYENAADASGVRSALSAKVASRRMERGGVVLTTTHTIIAEMTQDWSLWVALK